ncbi:MAG: mono/diheme cytochrome c family protein [Gammaproteobacteria bacterium]|jgi:mono/diheme cytochrome c family protein
MAKFHLICICVLSLGLSMTVLAANDEETVNVDYKPYNIIDGNIDENTFTGWKTYNGGGCGGCHGRGGSGGVASDLSKSLFIKNDKEKFKDIVINGYKGSLMKPHRNDKRVMKNLENLYSYLKARADGVLGPENLIKHPLGRKE